MVNDILLTTPQVSAQIGATESAIRTAKSRNKDRLLEGTHWIADSGRTLWTGTGVEVLQELLTCNGSVAVTPALPDCNATVTATEPLPGGYQGNASVTATAPLQPCNTAVTADLLNPISQFADAIAWEVIEHQLPGAIQSSIHRILANPNDVDRDRLLALLERIGTGVGLVKLSAIFAGGLREAIASSGDSIKVLEGHNETT